MAKIHSIMVKPEAVSRDKSDQSFIRVGVMEASLEIGHGILGDAKGGRHTDRQLNILSLAWVERLQNLGYKTMPGSFGEQLIVTEINVDVLGSGDQLFLGDEAIIEITKPRIGCVRLETAQDGGHFSGEKVGMLARVVQGGVIRVGDTVLKGD